MAVYNIPYGHSFLPLDTGRHPAVCIEPEISRFESCADAAGLIREAMDRPFGGKSLQMLAKGKKNAVIIISDHTRPVPSKVILPPMLKALREAEPDIRIRLLVATGCHRLTSAEELRAKLGDKIFEEEEIVVHDCDHSPMTDLGKLPSGAELILNSLAVEADLLLAEGFIEPHFFAGFSGGRKSILPGICSRRTVLGNHCADFIADPHAVTGILEGNPIHRDMEAAARMAGLAYIVNVVLDHNKQPAAAFAGDPFEVHHAGCAWLRERCSVKPEQRSRIVVTSNGGAPLDQNVYQAVKGMTAGEQAAEPGGTIILCAECADGVGGDSFYRALSSCSSPAALMEEILQVPMEETIPDQWQYQILVRILMKYHVIMVARPELSSLIREMKMDYAETLEEALELAETREGAEAPLTIIPDGVSVIVQAP